MAFPSAGIPAPVAIPLAGLVAQEQTSNPTEPQQQPTEPAKQNPPAAPEPSNPPANSVPQPESPKSASPSETPKMPGPSPKPAASSTANKTKRRRKHPAVSQAPAGPPKVVVKNGGTTDPAVKISPSLTQQQASSQRQSASQLLDGTGVNLKKISNRQLSASQQDMVKQIQQYMEEAKAAGDAGDLEREHNLALKANLLSEELVKP
jgi:hypothetical protein